MSIHHGYCRCPSIPFFVEPNVFVSVQLQATTSGEEIAGLIGDRSDPQFESEFLNSGEDNDNKHAVGDEAVDALFKAF